MVFFHNLNSNLTKIYLIINRPYGFISSPVSSQSDLFYILKTIFKFHFFISNIKKNTINLTHLIYPAFYTSSKTTTLCISHQTHSFIHNTYKSTNLKKIFRRFSENILRRMIIKKKKRTL